MVGEVGSGSRRTTQRLRLRPCRSCRRRSSCGGVGDFDGWPRVRWTAALESCGVRSTAASQELV